MSCNQIGEHLIDAAMGVAPPSQVQSHLRECRQCAACLEELRQTFALLDQWKAPEPSLDFDTSLQARLSFVEKGPRFCRHCSLRR